MEYFQLEVLAEFLPYLNQLSGATLEEKLRILLSIYFSLERMVPFETAVQLSGQSYGHFAELFRSIMLPLI